MQRNRGALASRQSFKKSTSKNPKKKKTNDRAREEEDEEGESGSRCGNKEDLTDIE